MMKLNDDDIKITRDDIIEAMNVFMNYYGADDYVVIYDACLILNNKIKTTCPYIELLITQKLADKLLGETKYLWELREDDTGHNYIYQLGFRCYIAPEEYDMENDRMVNMGNIVATPSWDTLSKMYEARGGEAWEMFTRLQKERDEWFKANPGCEQFFW